MKKAWTSVIIGTIASTVHGSTIDDCHGYSASHVKRSYNGLVADLTLLGSPCNVYGNDIKNLKLQVDYQGDSRLHVKIYDADRQVYQIPESVLPSPSNDGGDPSQAALKFSYTTSPFSFAVTRSDSGEVLFNTSGTQLVFESQYVRLRTQLPQNPNLYGLGEHTDSFRLQTTGYTRTMWNAESPYVPRKFNLYGSHPMYLDHRASGHSHGVFLRNSDGMNIVIDQTQSGAQYLEYNTIGGVLDFYFLAGPSPTEVSKQYAEVVGLPAMVPYWSFGFMQCKYGYWDVNELAEVVGNYSTAGIPLDVLWSDIDYMDLRQDFTTDPDRFPIPKMRELVHTLHDRGQKFVMMVDPGIHRKGDYGPFARGSDKDVFLKAADGSYYRGVQWAGEVVWPDWLNPNTQDWWTDEFLRFFDPNTGLDIDGVWNDMNEFSNFCGDINCNPGQQAIDTNTPPPPSHQPRPNTGRPIPGFPGDFQPTSSSRVRARRDAESRGTMKGLPGRNLFTPPYRINNHIGDLSDGTVYTNITNYDGSVQYDTHNLNGFMMAAHSRVSMLARRPGKRPFVLTRSTFAGAGSKVAHWFGDNYSAWDDYRFSISQMLAFAAVHQMPMVGSDVCGFNGNAQENMCARWALLGAFQPFYRNHADISAPNQEFYLWASVTEAAKKAIAARYRLLDYIYTAMYRSSTTGTPLVNPMFFTYPNDANTFGIQTQYFFGDSILVSPVIDDDAQSVTIYLPNEIFYDFWTFKPVRGNGQEVTLNNVAYTDLPAYIRGGSIIPMRSDGANSTTALRQHDFNVVVAPGLDGKASGSLMLDDGESIDGQASHINFSWDGKQFKATGQFGYQTDLKIQTVTILGDESVTKKGPWGLNRGFSFNS
nr:alpha-glucosidase precursor [Trichoderma koningiopsis]